MNLDEKQYEMIRHNLLARGINNKKIINAFKKVQRHLFVREEDQHLAYDDYPLDIGYNQTISQPYIVALMIQYLEINREEKVLEIGTGSGYQTAILSLLAKEIYTVELNENLASEAMKKLKRMGYLNIDYKQGNGYDGFIEHSPFDKIIVSCAANKIPDELINQLKENGKMIIPISNLYLQHLHLITKKNNQVIIKIMDAVRFVPMLE